MQPYIHHAWIFEQTGTTFAFLFFGSAAVVWALLTLQSYFGNEHIKTSKYDSVSTDEEIIELKNDMGDNVAVASKKKDEKKKHKNKKIIDPVKCTEESITLLMNNLTQFGAILFYSWFCENRPVFEHSEKHYSRDIFWFITLIYLAFALTTMKSNPKDTSLLNREQTEEWKGWMQFLFLMYHYFHASEVYNSIRVYISCYVWMTGFGNFSFFYIKRDFGAVRFWQMMWRLNFLVFWLIMIHGNTFILYYINPLHTFYFLMVFVTMWIGSSCNHDKYPVRWKVLCLALIIFLIWDVPGVFKFVWVFLPRNETIGAKFGVLHEWHFRSGLDHYSALFGMAFALNYPLAQAWLKSTEEMPWKRQWYLKSIVLSIVAIGLALWVNEIFLLPKLRYNEHHAYTFWIPLLGYIFIRNCSETLRGYHLDLLTRMGKITLETYLMQHHIWLTSNAKTLLVIIPGSPLCNFFVVSMIYLFLSNRLFRLTVGLRAMLVPNDLSTAGQLFFTMCTTLATFYGIAKVLNVLGGEIFLVIIVTIMLGVVGFILVRKVIDDGTVQGVRSPYIMFTGFIALVVCVGLALEVYLKNPPMPAPDPQGGIAQSIRLGGMVIFVYAVIVFTMDNYVGISHLSSMLGCHVMPSWEAAYSSLHNKIFSK
ncbi:hypothetical protein AAMO2058_000601100 [Amorphochlora amoebiformis]